MTFDERLSAINHSFLEPIVCEVLQKAPIKIKDWSMSPLSGGITRAAGSSYGLYRFQGHVVTDEVELPWSTVLKATAGSLSGSNTISSWDYWKREILAYQSGLLADLPGNIRAPRCYRVDEYPGDEFWIWLEDIPASSVSDWTLEHYGQVARQLGQFNGHFLSNGPLPNFDWLSGGRVKEWLDWSDPVLRDLRELCKNPLAKSWFRNDNLERTITLWQVQKDFLELLDSIPHTLCHHDAHPRNLMLPPGSSSQEKTVAVDWQILGKGAVGEEIAALVGVSAQFLDFPAQDMRTLDKIVFDSYVEGLRDAGWTGDERIVRFGYAASAALFCGVGWVGPFLPFVLKDNAAVGVEKFFGCSLEHLLDQYALMQEFLLDLGDEARTLLSALM